ncbi:MAG: beta-lactamase family protein [Anaerolineales bacterium]|nr:beta-lactamase family protein [Anaerolineales bacterium]
MQASPIVQSSLAEKIDPLFSEWDKAGTPGCALGVIHNGQLIYARGYGMANLEDDTPIGPGSVFDIASTSKQFTAMCILLLAEQGALALDDDIHKYLPELPDYGCPLTIRHLLHHTSGLRDYLELFELASARPDDCYTDQDVMEMLARQKELNFLPGARFLYSNSGYYLLGQIVSRVSGQSLRQFAGEHIFQPLGMRRTHFHDDHTEIVKQRAIGYSPREADGLRIDMSVLEIVGDGGVLTCVEDLVLWDRNFYHNRLGKGNPELVRQMLATGSLNDGESLRYACGLIVGDYRGLAAVYHSGGWVGFRSEMLRFPEQSLSVICLANLSAIDPIKLARQAAGVLLAELSVLPPPAPVRALELAAQDLEIYAGHYCQAASGLIVQLNIRDNHLSYEDDDVQIALEALGGGRFRPLESPYDFRITFERAAPAYPWKMILDPGDEPADVFQHIQPAQVDPEQLNEFAGTYYSEELETTYALVVQGEQLYLRRKNIPDEALQTGLEDMFWRPGLALRFVRGRSGRAPGGPVGFRLSVDGAYNILFLRRSSPAPK